uniref:Uncharacterized protein n=1 Tax=Salix viminalis TaxID=40686 RepID=A0A6N2N8I7_SALVM
MDGEILFGRELTVVFAEENRKKPAEMRARDPADDTLIAGALHHQAMDEVILVYSLRRRHYSRSAPSLMKLDLLSSNM